MLPGPVLVVMVTKTGGFSRDWIFPGADWSDTLKWGGRDGEEGGSDVTLPPVHKWEGSSLRPPANTHRHNGHVFLRWG